MAAGCGVNCISETLSEAKQDDIYCRLEAACLAFVTARGVLWNVDFQSWDLSVIPGSCFPCQEQEQASVFFFWRWGLRLWGEGKALQGYTLPRHLQEAVPGVTAGPRVRPHEGEAECLPTVFLKN